MTNNVSYSNILLPFYNKGVITTITETYEMKQYDNVCARFEAAGIAYKETAIDGYRVTFELSKGGINASTLIDFSGDYVEESAKYAILSLEQVIEWSKKEAERQARRRKRGI